MADRYLLESGAPDGILHESGSGVLLLESELTVTPIEGILRHSSRFLGALLVSTLALTGTVRATASLTGAATANILQPIEGTLRHSSVVRSVSMVMAYPAAQVRHTARLTGAQLDSDLPLAGTVRHTARLTGAVGFAAPLAGTLRSTASLTGGAPTFTLPMAGTLRHSARLTGPSTLGGEEPVLLPVTGRVRITQSRLRTLSFLVAYPAAPIRSTARLTGNVSLVFGTPPLQGTIRHSERLGPAELVTTFPVAELSGTSARLIGFARVLIKTHGTIRSTQRLTGNLTVFGTELTGRIRHTASLRGEVQFITAEQIAGTVRHTARLTGDTTLHTVQPLAGTIRSTASVTGTLNLVTEAALQGTIRSTVRLTGALSQVYSGTVLGGQAIVYASALSLPTPGATALAGTIRHAARLTGDAEVLHAALFIRDLSGPRYRLEDSGIVRYDLTDHTDARYGVDP